MAITSHPECCPGTRSGDESLSASSTIVEGCLPHPIPRTVETQPVDPAITIDHPSGFLALSRRNDRFTTPDGPGFIAFREQGRHLFVLGGVHAPAPYRGVLLDRFLRLAAARSRDVMIVQLRVPQLDLFRERGFVVNQLGTNFGLTLGSFTLGGTPKMRLRNKISRARRAGLQVVELGVDLPCSASRYAAVDALSQAWLKTKRGKELDFMVGELGKPADSGRRIFVALDENHRYQAFITYVPVWGDTPGYLHDLTRRHPHAPPGALELINATVIEKMVAEQTAFLHLGFTPLVVDEHEPPGANRLVGWLLRALYQHGRALYPARTQASYKLKWGPDITEREYIAARSFSVRGVYDLLTLTRSI